MTLSPVTAAYMHTQASNLDFGEVNGESVHIPLVNIGVHSEK